LKSDDVADFLDTAGVIGIALFFLVSKLYKQETGRSIFKWFASLSCRVKQLTILLVIAAWYSACLAYSLSEYTREGYAALVAFIYTTPVIAFGGIALWWIGPTKRG
jgi:hypothetical protein